VLARAGTLTEDFVPSFRARFVLFAAAVLALSCEMIMLQDGIIESLETGTLHVLVWIMCVSPALGSPP
jgi:hypothetical protein